jgi:hypothetical protein
MRRLAGARGLMGSRVFTADTESKDSGGYEMDGLKLPRVTLGILLLLMCIATQTANAQYVHPGGLHTLADLNRMKTQVAAGAHPWIDDWNLLIADPLSKNTYTSGARANMGASWAMPPRRRGIRASTCSASPAIVFWRGPNTPRDTTPRKAFLTRPTTSAPVCSSTGFPPTAGAAWMIGRSGS